MTEGRFNKNGVGCPPQGSSATTPIDTEVLPPMAIRQSSQIQPMHPAGMVDCRLFYGLVGVVIGGGIACWLFSRNRN